MPSDTKTKSKQPDPFVIFAEKGYKRGSLTPLEALKLLLYACLDDSSQAEEKAEYLLMKFSTLNAVIHADYYELLSDHVFNENEANRIVMIGATFLRIRRSVPFPKKLVEADLREYLSALFCYETHEKLYMITIKNNRAVKCLFLAEGEETKVGFDFAKLLRRLAETEEADEFILAHNHPYHSCKPSNQDISTTDKIMVDAMRLGLKLRAHYVVGTDGIDVVPERENFMQYLVGSRM